MTYLAEVTKTQQFNSKAIALLLAQKRSDGLWMSAQRREISINNRDLNLKQLIVVEVDAAFGVVSIIAANEALIMCLRDWSVRLSRFDSNKAEIALTKESLEYQSKKLYQREQGLHRREEIQSEQEKKLAKLQLLAKNKLDAAEVQHIALTEAWQHLHYREEQLNNTPKGIKDKRK